MPWPVTRYIATAMATSRQPRPHPQATGTAASTARNGMAIIRVSTTFSNRRFGSVSITGPAAAGTVERAAALAGGVMTVLGVGGGGRLRHRNFRVRNQPDQVSVRALAAGPGRLGPLGPP